MIASYLSRLARAGWNPTLRVLRPGANRDGWYLVAVKRSGERERRFEGSSPDVALRRAVRAVSTESEEGK